MRITLTPDSEIWVISYFSSYYRGREYYASRALAVASVEARHPGSWINSAGVVWGGLEGRSSGMEVARVYSIRLRELVNFGL